MGTLLESPGTMKRQRSRSGSSMVASEGQPEAKRRHAHGTAPPRPSAEGYSESKSGSSSSAGQPSEYTVQGRQGAVPAAQRAGVAARPAVVPALPGPAAQGALLQRLMQAPAAATQPVYRQGPAQRVGQPPLASLGPAAAGAAGASEAPLAQKLGLTPRAQQQRPQLQQWQVQGPWQPRTVKLVLPGVSLGRSQPLPALLPLPLQGSPGAGQLQPLAALQLAGDDRSAAVGQQQAAIQGNMGWSLHPGHDLSGLLQPRLSDATGMLRPVITTGDAPPTLFSPRPPSGEGALHPAGPVPHDGFPPGASFGPALPGWVAMPQQAQQQPWQQWRRHAAGGAPAQQLPQLQLPQAGTYENSALNAELQQLLVDMLAFNPQALLSSLASLAAAQQPPFAAAAQQPPFAAAAAAQPQGGMLPRQQPIPSHAGEVQGPGDWRLAGQAAGPAFGLGLPVRQGRQQQQQPYAFWPSQQEQQEQQELMHPPVLGWPTSGAFAPVPLPATGTHAAATAAAPGGSGVMGEPAASAGALTQLQQQAWQLPPPPLLGPPAQQPHQLQQLGPLVQLKEWQLLGPPAQQQQQRQPTSMDILQQVTSLTSNFPSLG